MIRKQRVVADRDSRKIITGNETSYYENAISQSEKQERHFGGTAATNDRGSNQAQRNDGERSRFGVAPN